MSVSCWLPSSRVSCPIRDGSTSIGAGPPTLTGIHLVAQAPVQFDRDGSDESRS